VVALPPALAAAALAAIATTALFVSPFFSLSFPFYNPGIYSTHIFSLHVSRFPVNLSFNLGKFPAIESQNRTDIYPDTAQINLFLQHDHEYEDQGTRNEGLWGFMELRLRGKEEWVRIGIGITVEGYSRYGSISR
jgi:hypothetical protein